MKTPVRKIEVIAYEPEWPKLFAEEAARLSEALREVPVEVHHIGSTAVPGMSAKPIIDILVEVSDLRLLDGVASSMELIGYVAKGEFGIPGRRFYLKGVIERTHHVHAFEQGSTGLRRHLAVRDYLREHPDQAAEYGRLKSEIATRFQYDNDGYCEAKCDFVAELECRALVWKSQCEAVG